MTPHPGGFGARHRGTMLVTCSPSTRRCRRLARSAVVTRAAQADTGAPALAVNPQGQVLVAWRDARDRVIVRAGASGRTRVAGRTEWGGTAEAALRADGFAAVLYLHRPLRGGRRTLEVATARPGRAFSRPRTLVSVVANVGAYRVFAAGDRFVAVWSQAKAVRYAVSDTAGRFGPARTLARVDGEAQVERRRGREWHRPRRLPHAGARRRRDGVRDARPDRGPVRRPACPGGHGEQHAARVRRPGRRGRRVPARATR